VPPPFSVSVPRRYVLEQSLLLDCLGNPHRQCADPRDRSASGLKALLDLANGSYVFLFYILYTYVVNISERRSSACITP
jgi:hypothetical protein